MKSKILTKTEMDKIVRWQRALPANEILLSSWSEICPWYRRGLGYFAFAKMCNIPLDVRQRFKIFITSLMSLYRSSYIQSKFPPLETKVPYSWIVSWSISASEKSSDAVRRYFGGEFAEKCATGRSLPWIVCAFPAPVEYIERLAADGACVVFSSRPHLGALVEMIGHSLSIRSRVVLDAEYWRSYWTSKILRNFIKTFSVQSVEMRLPYEQQPWQLAMIKTLKDQLGGSAVIVGDIHSSMNSIPLQFTKMAIAPTKLIVHGHAYVRVLSKWLGWNIADIFLENSRRYKSKMVLKKNTIFLPYDLSSANRTFQEIKNALERLNRQNQEFEVRVHPARTNEQTHMGLRDRLMDSFTFSKVEMTEKPVAFVVGVSTTLLEALEAGYEAIGIYENPATEVFSDEIWSELKVHWLSTNTVHYELSALGSFVIYPD